MVLTSKLTAYDHAWPAMFRAERDRIAPAFGGTLVAIHHAGSTAVPGLTAKPEIDMLIDVSDYESGLDDALDALGYRRGKDLTPGHRFYRRDVDGIRTHKLHVCVSGHQKIGLMLRFRDLLRSDPAVRQRYQALKLRLEAENRDGMAEYLSRKEPFIDACLEAMPTGGHQRDE